MKAPQRLRRAVPGSVAGLAGLARAACCLIPALLGARSSPASAGPH